MGGKHQMVAFLLLLPVRLVRLHMDMAKLDRRFSQTPGPLSSLMVFRCF